MAYLYNYVGEPWKTQRRIRQIADEFLKPPDGLIGNEDRSNVGLVCFECSRFLSRHPGSPTYVIGTSVSRKSFQPENKRVL